MSSLPSHIEKEGTIGAPEEEGIVIETVQNLARIKVTKSSSCSTCSIAGNCPFNAIGKKDWLIWAKNEYSARKGDRVKISISSRRYILIAALIFIMPVSVLLATYIIAKLLGAIDQFAVALSVTFAFISYFIIRGIDRGSGKNAGYEVVEIVEKFDEMQQNNV